MTLRARLRPSAGTRLIPAMIPEPSEIFQVTRLVVAALDAAGVRCFLGGSVASALYGEARSTRRQLLTLWRRLAGGLGAGETLDRTGTARAFRQVGSGATHQTRP